MGLTPTNPLVIEAQVVEILRTVFDPEIPVNIYDIGLIYDIKVDSANAVTILMTLTSPNCPSAEQLPVEVETQVRALPGVTGTRVEVVWDPPWDPSKMSDAAKLELGML